MYYCLDLLVRDREFSHCYDADHFWAVQMLRRKPNNSTGTAGKLRPCETSAGIFDINATFPQGPDPRANILRLWQTPLD
jgi:hypothetical protein